MRRCSKGSRIGGIPDDWNFSILAELSSAITDGTHYTPVYVSHGIPFYSVENVTADNFQNTKNISLHEHLKLVQRCKPEKGDILMTRIGDLGSTKLIDWEVEASIYVSLALIKVNSKIESEYLFCYTQSNCFKQDVEKLSLANAVPKKINLENIFKIPILVPSLKSEQKAIASSLMDVDALIQKLDKLIRKKRDMKTAVMQQLLTGKKRLPGFEKGKGYKQSKAGMIPEDWGLRKLGDVTLKIGSGVTPTGGSSVYRKDGRPFVRSQNVAWGRLNLSDIVCIDDATHSTFAATEIKSGDVFLNITGASIGRSALADEQVLGGNVNQHVCIIRSNQLLLAPEYLNLLLLSPICQDQIRTFQAGGNREGLNFRQVASLNIPHPCIAEQKIIASVLSDYEEEYQQLYRKMVKVKAIKQGMMQELLTGKTRLV